jgi:hypothetical protein
MEAAFPAVFATRDRRRALVLFSSVVWAIAGGGVALADQVAGPANQITGTPPTQSAIAPDPAAQGVANQSGSGASAASSPAASSPAASSPVASSPGRFFGGVRLGLEARSGDVTVQGSESGPGFSSSSTVHYTGHQQVPLTLDVGGRLSPNVTLGGYARLAAVLGGQTDVSWSLGAILGVLPAPAASICPWIAVAVGYQTLGSSAPLTGLEIVPQVGILFEIGHYTLGPVAEVTLVDYSADASVCSNCSGWNGWGSLALRAGWM